MTRENKLALVVGFGLILFVGILISDHFSTARLQQSAVLSDQPVDPLVRAGYEDPMLIEMQPAGTNDSANAMLTNPTRHAMDRSRTNPPPTRPQTLVLGEANPTIGPAPEAVESLDWIFHTVRDNETLTEIARHYYRDGSLTSELAGFNNIANPDAIRPGHRIRIPSDDVLVRGRTAESTRQAHVSAASPRKKSGSYVVRSGDTLSEIASEQLGSAKKWRAPFDLNRDVIPNPDRLLEGTRLKLP